MSLLDILSSEITDQTRQIGQQYYRSGAARIDKVGDCQIDATIVAKQPLHVEISWKDDELSMSCDCSYFGKTSDICGHIWATFLAANGRGCLPEGELHGLRLMDGGDDEEGEEEDEGDFEFDNVDFAVRDEKIRERIFAALAAPPFPVRAPAPPLPAWQQAMVVLQQGTAQRAASWPAAAEPAYLIDADASRSDEGLLVEFAARTRKKNGDWSLPKPRRLTREQAAELPDPADRKIAAVLTGSRSENDYGYTYYQGSSAARSFRLSHALAAEVVPLLCRTGRCFLRAGTKLNALQWDDGPPWSFHVKATPEAKQLRVTAELIRGGERLDLGRPLLLLAGGLVFTESHAGLLDDAGAFEWLGLLRRVGALIVPAKDAGRWLAEVLALPRLPKLELPPELQYEAVVVPAQFRIKISKNRHAKGRLNAAVFFRYGEHELPAGTRSEHHFFPEKRLLVRRDPLAEGQAAALLFQLGFRDLGGGGGPWGLAARNLPKAVQTLSARGWQVEADGKLYRQPGDFHIDVRTGIDWFELHGTMQFGEQTASLPELLAAVRKGQSSVQLGDGTFGMLPEKWLKKYGLLAGSGQTEKHHLRFSRVQVGLLDALLAAQPEARCDTLFEQARDELRRFDGIVAVAAPAEFAGELRGYQKEGLGWLHFLERFGFGGCLADDMGLGKTVMVLALLESRRQLRGQTAIGERPPPSLAVVPRSLIFNWIEEAKRFTPRLRVLDHSGVGRLPPGGHFNDHDLILTTYGTLRRDIATLKDFAFDYCILDEAQAIKNARTDSAKAARLIQGRRRLVLSGTPVENHLGELWSLLDFLNPGMLGSTLRLEGGWRNPSSEARQLLACALRPVILRRTKEQVAKDLPAKTEQTLCCELEGEQRRLYNELRDHFRQSLLARVQRDGIKKSKMHILEALLRLRQAACHAGLIDKDRVADSSGKLEVLLPQLAEVIDEGHKALVFSQFTSLLAIVRDRLDQAGITYQYLDGRTRDRQAKVEAFQNDATVKLFLISLKAGGLGLNLTAAEYVFLLDPWWNPAVEAQAIDRAHRIGQDKPVFAYRLIAKDTVEEKVLELQRHKRALADAIINADNSLIRDLGREDLELLLS